MTPHSPAFAPALAAVEALLGPADATEDIVEPYPATIARWGHAAGANLTVRHYGITGSVVLVAERFPDDREWRAIGDATVRDACAWLSWEVPRPPRVGYDANGSPVEGA